jgi:hypothetical protein
MKAMLGHDGPPTSLWRANLISGDSFERCPVRTIQLARADPRSVVHEVERYIDVYHPAYQDGHLLVQGGIADQPSRYLAIIGEIRAASARVERKMLEISKENADSPS